MLETYQKSSLHLKKIASVRGFRAHSLLLIPGKQTVEINPDIRLANNEFTKIISLALICIFELCCHKTSFW